MSPTVDELRNEIRRGVGRHDRIEPRAFTKEALAAICAAVGYEVDRSRLPSKARMRAEILRTIGVLDEAEVDDADRPFRKAELEAIASALREA